MAATDAASATSAQPMASDRPSGIDAPTEAAPSISSPATSAAALAKG
jgi:hypothetical protein